MAVVYATLIIKGKKTINDVPIRIREQVKQVLIDLDLPELAEETESNLFQLQRRGSFPYRYCGCC